MAEQLGERTELPTGKRRFEARERGQLGKSAELSAALTLAAGSVLCFVFAEDLFFGLARIMRHLLGGPSAAAWLTEEGVTTDVPLVTVEVAKLLLPFMAIAMLVSYAIGYTQVGFLLSSKILHPNWSRLNFIAGFGRLFQRRQIVKASIDTLKLALIAAVSVAVVQSSYPAVVALASVPAALGSLHAAELVRDLAIWILAILLILGIADWSYQKWQLTEDLRMTRQEVQDEHRSTDGDVKTKGRRMKLARQMLLQRMGTVVPQADVIVTNPTHFAVALKYDSAKMSAPKVTAKGADYLAMKMRYLAAAHGVPIIERPPLARALYHDVPVGREISAQHYEAVAEVLAYVYRLERKAAG